jgi:hypothetical protein
LTLETIVKGDSGGEEEGRVGRVDIETTSMNCGVVDFKSITCIILIGHVII